MMIKQELLISVEDAIQFACGITGLALEPTPPQPDEIDESDDSFI